MTGMGLDLKNVDHMLCDRKFQFADPMPPYRIQRVGQAVIEILLGFDSGKDDIKHRALTGEPADPVQLHDLEQDGGDHGNGRLSVCEPLSPGVRGHVLIDDIRYRAFFEVMSQDRSKADALRGNVFDGGGCIVG